jgi:stage II sporulation protein AA (anti-sigma F factor antagonist)
MPSDPSSESPLEVDVVRIGVGVVVAFHGELDVGNAAAMRDHLAEILSQNPPHLKLEVNLSEVQFIDSVCIGLLVTTGHRLKESGGSLAILNPSPTVRSILRIMGLVPVLMPDAEAVEL